MAITRAQKEETLKQLTEDLKQARGVVFTEYKGLTVAQINKMRRKLRAEKVKYQVVKVTLLKKALASLNISGELKFNGPVAVATSSEEETTPARILKAAVKEYPQLVLDGGIFQSQIVASDVVERLASLPSKEALDPVIATLFLLSNKCLINFSHSGTFCISSKQ